MKMTMRLLAATMLVLGLAVSAQALSITPSTLPQWTGTDQDQPDIDAVIGPIIGTAVELYKADVDDAPGDTGTLAGSYQTVYSSTPTDPSAATVSYVSGQIVGGTAWALVKDGNSTPAWYLFNLSTLGWDGVETLEFSGFWPTQGAISHIALYGTPDDPDIPVPDGGSMSMLLGAALIALAGVRRMMA